jgi:hypothetical protein
MRIRIGLTGLPVLGLVAGVFFANRTSPYVLGLPFLMFYVAAWLLLSSVLMGAVAWLDRSVTSDGDPRGGEA